VYWRCVCIYEYIQERFLDICGPIGSTVSADFFREVFLNLCILFYIILFLFCVYTYTVHDFLTTKTDFMMIVFGFNTQ